MRCQLVHVHRLHRACTLLVPVLAPPPRRAPDAHEVRRLEAGPVPVGLDKRLHQPRAIAVAGLEISPQAAQHTAQHMAREVTATHPGTNQKPAQAHDTVQMGSTLLLAPRHPRVARAQMQRRRGHPQRPQHPMRRDDEVAQLAADKRRRAVGMLAMKERVPHHAPLFVLHQHQREPFDIPQLIGHIHGRRHCSVETAWRRCPLVMTGGRERNSPRVLQHLQRLQAARKLRSSPGIDKPELAAHALPDQATAGKWVRRHNTIKTRLGIERAKGAENLALDHHAVSYTRRGTTCSD